MVESANMTHLQLVILTALEGDGRFIWAPLTQGGR